LTSAALLLADLAHLLERALPALVVLVADVLVVDRRGFLLPRP
jgi:hypothetical protein